ncbi:MAG: ATP-binding protein [Acidobacteriota bacterium]
MSMNTHLQGRLRNTPLPTIHGLLCLFEAVVNSIQATDERSPGSTFGKITIEILRVPQMALQLDDGKAKRGSPPLESITGFKVTDNGMGFTDDNMASFETLDGDYKAHLGCRGVGRLLWLKAFESVAIDSIFVDPNGVMRRRTFKFAAARGVDDLKVQDVTANTEPRTCVHLQGFVENYRKASPKTAMKIANNLLEHCLWYFVREGGAPTIEIIDESESIRLDDVYEEYMFSSAKKESMVVKGQSFELTHIRLKATSANTHVIGWCAAARLVEEETIVGKVPGLYGRISDEAGDFVYACYVTSPFLDQHVRPERFGFDIKEMSDDLFADAELSLSEIRSAVIGRVAFYLDGYLQEKRKASRDRIEAFASKKAPRYRPILGRIHESGLDVDPNITDKDLDLVLHKQLSELESSLLSEGHEVMNFGNGETPDQYRKRLSEYLAKVDDIKKSDLANYVFHRKVILDILQKAIQVGPSGKYAAEDLIHELIMPMRKTSNEIRSDSCNLWLIDERLAFHDFLASDKTLSAMPIVNSQETKEPDICALNVFDEPILVAEGQNLPLASIVVVEIKRPMRNDARAGEDKDPVEQALGYLERIRNGEARTASGRPIPKAETIPGFCYAICDITPSVERRCKLLGLKVTSDHLGYFGYNSNYEAYIEVISFDRLLNAARERNRAFFDKLGLPVS